MAWFMAFYGYPGNKGPGCDDLAARKAGENPVSGLSGSVPIQAGVLTVDRLIATKVGMGKSGQFTNHLVDAMAEQPPGVTVWHDRNVGFGAKPCRICSLFF